MIIHTPHSIEDVQEIVRQTSQAVLVPRGKGTKTALSPAEEEAVIEMDGLSGIIEYDPGEYTFSAYAGTPIKEIEAALAENNQYLPWDPILVERGATLGGTVAANLSGSGRYRYGGLRDFIIGIHFVDGNGQHVLGGGKVVKNSAGFDLPKFFAGSLGYYGILTDVGFKVFPQPADYITLSFTFSSAEDTLHHIFKTTTKPNEIDALDVEATPDGEYILLARMGGLTDVLPGRGTRLEGVVEASAERLMGDEDRSFWRGRNDLDWASDVVNIVKVPIAPRQMPMLEDRLGNTPLLRRYTAGANVAWIAGNNISGLGDVLDELGLVGLHFIGDAGGSPFIGTQKGIALAQRAKRALDPEGRFVAVG